MSAPLEAEIEAALAELRAQHDKIKEVDATMAGRTTSASSKDRTISATVDGSGRLVELSFKGNRYRNLPPAELAARIVETVSSAQEEAAKGAMAAVAGIVPEAFGLAGLRPGELDLDAMLQAALRMAEQPVFGGGTRGSDRTESR